MRNITKILLLLLPVAHSSLAAFEGSGVEIEEVVVTAQKRSQSLQDVPISVSALSEADLEVLKLDTGSDIAAYVPNLSVNQPYGEGSAPFFSLRGVTTTDYSHNQSSPIAMYVDESYKSVGALQSLQLFDLERIEVLRGPQGSLYGKNATGGAVNFIAKKPSFDEAGYLTLGLGNYSRQEAKGAFQTGLVDDVLATRLAFTFARADGVTENKFPGGDDQGEIDQWAFRLGFLYQPTEGVDAYLRLAKSRSTGENHGVLADGILTAIDPLATGTPVPLGVDRAGLDFDETDSDFDIPERELENQSVALTINWSLDYQHGFTSITAYDEGKWISPEDDDGLSISLDHNDFNSEVRQITQEFRLTSDYNGKFNWIGGLFWGEDVVDSESTLRLWNEASLGLDFGLGGLGFNETNAFTQTRASTAAYWHSTYDMSEALTLTFGLRYTEDEVEVDDYVSFLGATPIGGVPQFDIPSISNPPKVDFTDRNTSGKLGLDWAINEEIMAYASFSQGYRSGAVNGQAFVDAAEITRVDPEELESWEFGIKSRFFDNRVQLNGAVFLYDYTNQQYVDLFNALTVLRNADKSELKGFELEARLQAAENLSLRLGLGYIDSEFKDLTLADGTDLSGNELIATPEWSVTASLDWGFLDTKAGSFSLHLDTSYSDEQYFDAANTDRIQLGDYWLSNGRLSFDAADDSYSISTWVKNLSDKEYETYSLDLQSFGLGFDYYSRGLPRTFGFEVTFRM